MNRSFKRNLALCLACILTLMATQALAIGYTGLLQNEATFETLEEVRVSAPVDVAAYYGNAENQWISHPLLDEYPEGVAFVYRSSNGYGGRTAWRNNTNFVVFAEEHFGAKDEAFAWLESTGLIPIIEEAKGSILIITPSDAQAGFTVQDAEVYYNIQTAQCAVGVGITVDEETYYVSEGEYFGGFAYKYAIGVDGGATFFNDHIATNEDYMGRFAGVALVGGSMDAANEVANLMPAYLFGAEEEVVEKYKAANQTDISERSAANAYYASSLNEAAQVYAVDAPEASLADKLTTAYYDLLVGIQRQPVAKRALLTEGMPYAEYVCDQSPYSLTKRTYFTGTAPSTPDASAMTADGMQYQGYYGQTQFAASANAAGEYIDTWFEYVPEEVALGQAEESSVPLVMLLHGNDDDMRAVANNCGWVQLAERERFIIAAPDHQFLERGQEKADALAEYVTFICEKYPQVDRSRVYVSGFSLGGMATCDVLLWHPELFAAAAPMAGLSGYDLDEARAAINQQYDIPVCFYMSTSDTLVLVTEFYDGQLKENIPAQISGLFALNDMEPPVFDFAVNKTFGFNGDLMRNYTINNEYTGGQHIFYNDADVPMFILTYSDLIIHALWAPQAELVWEHISQFSRNTDTGEVIYAPAE